MAKCKATAKQRRKTRTLTRPQPRKLYANVFAFWQKAAAVTAVKESFSDSNRKGITLDSVPFHDVGDATGTQVVHIFLVACDYFPHDPVRCCQLLAFLKELAIFRQAHLPLNRNFLWCEVLERHIHPTSTTLQMGLGAGRLALETGRQPFPTH